jgi:hypothetical protein
MPRSGKEVGRPAFVPEHLKGRVEAHADGRFRTLTDTVKGFFLAPRPQAEVVAYRLRLFRAFPKNPISTDGDADAAVIARLTDDQTVFRVGIAEAGVVWFAMSLTPLS